MPKRFSDTGAVEVFSRLPRILCIDVQRNRLYGSTRSQRQVLFDQHMTFNVSEDAHVDYHAIATFSHHGNHDGGHYTCCVKDAERWYYHNDGLPPKVMDTWSSACHPTETVRVMYLLENQAVGPPPPPPSPSDTLDLLAQVQKNTNISDSAAGAISHTPTPPAHPASSVTEEIFTAETEFKGPTTTPSASKFGAGLLHPPPATVHVTRLTDKQVRDRLEDLKTAKGDWLNIWFCVNHKKTQHATYKVHRLPSRVMSALNPDLYRIHREGTGAGEDIFIPNQQDSAYITHIEVKSRAIHTTLPSSQTQHPPSPVPTDDESGSIDTIDKAANNYTRSASV